MGAITIGRSPQEGGDNEAQRASRAIDQATRLGPQPAHWQQRNHPNRRLLRWTYLLPSLHMIQLIQSYPKNEVHVANWKQY